MSDIHEVDFVAIRCSVAAVNKGSSLRVYQTTVFGEVREAQYEGKWTGGRSSNVIATSKLDTPIAATSLGLDHIRVYYVGTDNKAREVCYDKGRSWYDGGFSKAGYKVAPYSQIAAVYLGGHSILRVYGQLPDNTIQEWCYDDDGKGWKVGANFGAVLPGSSIAATTWGGSPYHIRVYVQDKNLDIIEKCWDGSGWQNGGLRFSSSIVRASLGVTSWGDGDGLNIRLYYGDADDLIKEKRWGGGGGWKAGGFEERTVPASKVAAIPHPVLRVYCQKGVEYTAVTELAWDRDWGTGMEALPPA
ncbi:hypothetical protein CDD83_8715 [Cordyceps sp. RAO-2017]|nr:hypothetical protein CDD83_8715 [Cordyceps sp. RAO-2017]